MEAWDMITKIVGTVACLDRIVLNKWPITNNTHIFKGMVVSID
jgi:hypothetical protein